jgi:CRP-like cAMP-binding protein
VGSKRVVMRNLQQGDVIGESGVLCPDNLCSFSAVAKTAVRMLTLDREFFEENPFNISYLEEAVEDARAKLALKKVPDNDFKIYDKLRAQSS